MPQIVREGSKFKVQCSKFVFRFSFYSVFALGLFFYLAPTAHGNIYAYTDERGVFHFTNAPTNSRFQPWSGLKNILSPQSRELRAESRVSTLISQLSSLHKVDPSLVKAIIRVESNFNPNAISPKGAQGLMQLMPQKAEALDINNPFDPRQNIYGGVKHLRYLLDLFQGNVALALAAYNAGENAVLRYKTIPPFPETREYVKRVMSLYEPGGLHNSRDGRLEGKGSLEEGPQTNRVYSYIDEHGSIRYTNIPPIVKPGN